jgi:hypothetical protein
MAKIKMGPLVMGISGTMGDFVFRRSKSGEVIISQRPRKSNTPPSEAQQANRRRFAEASQYAKAALADPAIREPYEELAAKQGKSAFAVARTEYLQRFAGRG